MKIRFLALGVAIAAMGVVMVPVPAAASPIPPIVNPPVIQVSWDASSDAMPVTGTNFTPSGPVIIVAWPNPPDLNSPIFTDNTRASASSQVCVGPGFPSPPFCFTLQGGTINDTNMTIPDALCNKGYVVYALDNDSGIWSNGVTVVRPC